MDHPKGLLRDTNSAFFQEKLLLYNLPRGRTAKLGDIYTTVTGNDRLPHDADNDTFMYWEIYKRKGEQWEQLLREEKAKKEENQRKI